RAGGSDRRPLLAWGGNRIDDWSRGDIGYREGDRCGGRPAVAVSHGEGDRVIPLVGRREGEGRPARRGARGQDEWRPAAGDRTFVGGRARGASRVGRFAPDRHRCPFSAGGGRGGDLYRRGDVGHRHHRHVGGRIAVVVGHCERRRVRPVVGRGERDRCL